MNVDLPTVNDFMQKKKIAILLKLCCQYKFCQKCFVQFEEKINQIILLNCSIDDGVAYNLILKLIKWNVERCWATCMAHAYNTDYCIIIELSYPHFVEMPILQKDLLKTHYTWVVCLFSFDSSFITVSVF